MASERTALAIRFEWFCRLVEKRKSTKYRLGRGWLRQPLADVKQHQNKVVKS